MARNFWFDAFAAEKAEPITVRPLTKAERINNLRDGISRFQNRIANATGSEEIAALQDGLRIRETNLANLIRAAA